MVVNVPILRNDLLRHDTYVITMNLFHSGNRILDEGCFVSRLYHLLSNILCMKSGLLLARPSQLVGDCLRILADAFSSLRVNIVHGYRSKNGKSWQDECIL